MLEHAFGVTAGQEKFKACLEIARERHGELADMIPPVIAEARRQNNLTYRRSLITSKEHRYFLALLLNVPDRVKLLELVKQRFPDSEPVETVLNWVEQLASTRVMGATEANALGINNFDDDYLLVLQCLLEGFSLKQTKEAFEQEFSAEYAAGLGNKPEELYNSIRNSILFGSLFQDLPAPASSESLDNKQVISAQ
jgi:hypothetical protein